MTEEKRTETLIAQKNSREAEEVIDFMETLDKYEQREFLAFVQGAKFAKNLEVGVIRTA